jgi:hypothetical protein
MWMFDTFLLTGNCPSCGDKLSGIQSKAFKCNLDEYSLGESINFLDGDFIESGYITEHNYCSCNAKTRIIIKNGCYSGYTPLKEVL